jgi:hypothetical protein
MENDDSIHTEIPPRRVQSILTSPVIVARWLFVFLGVIWLILGVVSLVRMFTGDTYISGIGWIIILLMFVNSTVLVWIGWGVGKGHKRFFYLALIVLAGNTILTYTDEFGLLDMITLVIDVFLLILLLVTRTEFIAEER